MSLTQIYRLPRDIHLPAPLGNNHQTRSQDGLVSLLLPRPETGGEDIELADGRRIDVRLAIHTLVALFSVKEGVLRVVWLEG